MTNEIEKTSGTALIIALIAAAVLYGAYLAGRSDGRYSMQKEAVKSGAAEWIIVTKTNGNNPPYLVNTIEFQWNRKPSLTE